MSFSKWWAAPVIGAVLAACQADNRSQDQQIGVGVAEEYRSPADVPYLHDDEGNVLKSMPVEALKMVHAQLLAEGKTAIARNVELRYDFLTGEAKDFQAAIKAENYLKSQISKQPVVPVQEIPATERKVLNPDELPKGIQITDDMLTGLKKSASEGSAQ
jgi:hypothetical protein